MSESWLTMTHETWQLIIRDVLLACKTDEMPALPPPSPMVSPRQHATNPSSPLAHPADPLGGITLPRDRVGSGSTLKASRGDSSVPPVQKIGDRWIAASVLGHEEVGSMRRRDPGATVMLRDSVRRMFDQGPVEASEAEGNEVQTTPCSTEVNERIMAWQPVTERDLSIFGRTNPKLSEEVKESSRFSHVDVEVYPKAETALSFDPNDLNPSRSASQVRRQTSPDRRVRQANLLNNVVEDMAVDRSTTLPDPTHVSHVTFPKPAVGGMSIHPRALGAKVGVLEMIPSATNSTVETDRETLQTPSNETAYTPETSLDHTVVAKQEKQNLGHQALASQINGVHVDLRQAILSLSSAVAEARRLDEQRAVEIPKTLGNRLDTIHMDVKALENTLSISQLSTNRLVQAEQPAEGGELLEVHRKLDAIAKLCEEVLAKPVPSPAAEPSSNDSSKERIGMDIAPEDEKSAGDEVAGIMADIVSRLESLADPADAQTGASSKVSPRRGSLQVLHNVPIPTTHDGADSAGEKGSKLTDETHQQVGQVLALVTELRDARTLQTQQTTDMARCELRIHPQSTQADDQI